MPRDDEFVVGAEAHVEVLLMHHVVVAVAQQHEVVEVGGATVLPVPEVMCIAPADRSVAARETAATVAGGHRTEQVPGHRVLGTAVREREARVVTRDAVDDTVAGE